MLMFEGMDRETDTRSYKDFITFNFQYHILNMNFELHFNTINTITKVYQSGTHLAIYTFPWTLVSSLWPWAAWLGKVV